MGGTPSDVVSLCSAQPAQLHAAAVTPYFPFGNAHHAHNDLFNVHPGHSTEIQETGDCVCLLVCCLFFPGEHGTVQPCKIGLILNFDKVRNGCSRMFHSRMLEEKCSVLFCSRVLLKRFQFLLKHNG